METDSIFSFAMSLELKTARKLGFAGSKCTWNLKHDDVITIDGSEYIKLPRAGINYPFTRLVADGCDAIAKPLPSGFSMTQSRGYTQILELRNTAQSEALVDQAKANVPAMFRNVAKVKEVKLTREKMLEFKDSPEVLTIQLPPFGDFDEPFHVEMKRPMYAREDITVTIEVAVIKRVIEFIRFEGFDGNLKRPPSLPAGIQRNSGKHPYSYVFKRTDGKKSKHIAVTLDQAMDGIRVGPPIGDIGEQVHGDDDAADAADNV